MAKEKEPEVDKATKKIRKEAAQQKELATRKQQEADWERNNNAYIKKYFEEKLARDFNNAIITFNYLGPISEEEQEKHAQGEGMMRDAQGLEDAAEKGTPPRYGVYEVNINDKKQPYKLEFTANGVRPEPPSAEGWLAAIKFIVLEQHADTIEITCTRNPTYPKAAAESLLLRMAGAMKAGVAAELSEDAKGFLSDLQSKVDNKSYSKAWDDYWSDNEDKAALPLKDTLEKLEKISEIGLGFSRLQAATVENAAESWMVKDIGDMKALDDGHENALAAIRDANSAEDIKSEFQKFTKAFEVLQNSQDRLQEVKIGEQWVLEDPELLYKADQLKKIKSVDDKKIIKKVIGIVEDKKTVWEKVKESVNDNVRGIAPPDKFAEMRRLLAVYEGTQAGILLERSEQLIRAAETSDKHLRVMLEGDENIRDDKGLRGKIENAADIPAEEKAKMLKTLDKYDVALRGVDEKTSLAAQRQELRQWNAGSRQDELLKAKEGIAKAEKEAGYTSPAPR